MVVDTLSHKQVIAFITALSEVVSSFNDRIKKLAISYASYEKLRQ